MQAAVACYARDFRDDRLLHGGPPVIDVTRAGTLLHAKTPPCPCRIPAKRQNWLGISEAQEEAAESLALMIASGSRGETSEAR